MQEFFNQNGRITVPPYKTDTEGEGKDRFIIKYYKLGDLYAYSLQATLSGHVFARFPHPDSALFESIADAKTDAYSFLEKYCAENKLKKAFQRLEVGAMWQLDFDDLI